MNFLLIRLLRHFTESDIESSRVVYFYTTYTINRSFIYLLNFLILDQKINDCSNFESF